MLRRRLHRHPIAIKAQPRTRLKPVQKICKRLNFDNALQAKSADYLADSEPFRRGRSGVHLLCLDVSCIDTGPKKVSTAKAYSSALNSHGRNTLKAKSESISNKEKVAGR